MEKSIFKKASTTYYYSSLFFPKAVRDDVFKLYSFVRMADDCVDEKPQDYESFQRLRTLWQQYYRVLPDKRDSEASDDPFVAVARNMAELAHRYNFDPLWVDDFLAAMESDFRHKKCRTLRDSLTYVYGSAEVVGLMMARIMGLPNKAFTAAAIQGRAMQWVNFIRDVDEDNRLMRQYFPTNELKKFKLSNLSAKTAQVQSNDFKRFMIFQIERYYQWQTEAEAGYRYIPPRLLIPIKTANDMYAWTAKQILQNPNVVFERKVKPSKYRVLWYVLRNSFALGRGK